MATAKPKLESEELEPTSAHHPATPEQHHGAPQSEGHAPQTATDDEIAILAYSFWEERGRPDGSSEEDWFRAVAFLAAKPR